MLVKIDFYFSIINNATIFRYSHISIYMYTYVKVFDITDVSDCRTLVEEKTE